jgi:hypothetical protein
MLHHKINEYVSWWDASTCTTMNKNVMKSNTKHELNSESCSVFVKNDLHAVPEKVFKVL